MFAAVNYMHALLTSIQLHSVVWHKFMFYDNCFCQIYYISKLRTEHTWTIDYMIANCYISHLVTLAMLRSCYISHLVTLCNHCDNQSHFSFTLIQICCVYFRNTPEYIHIYMYSHNKNCTLNTLVYIHA